MIGFGGYKGGVQVVLRRCRLTETEVNYVDAYSEPVLGRFVSRCILLLAVVTQFIASYPAIIIRDTNRLTAVWMLLPFLAGIAWVAPLLFRGVFHRCKKSAAVVVSLLLGVPTGLAMQTLFVDIRPSFGSQVGVLGMVSERPLMFATYTALAGLYHLAFVYLACVVGIGRGQVVESAAAERRGASTTAFSVRDLVAIVTLAAIAITVWLEFLHAYPVSWKW